MADRDPPTRGQLTYLRDLAEQTGTTFSVPRTRREASAEIRRLKSPEWFRFWYRRKRSCPAAAACDRCGRAGGL